MKKTTTGWTEHAANGAGEAPGAPMRWVNAVRPAFARLRVAHRGRWVTRRERDLQTPAARTRRRTSVPLPKVNWLKSMSISAATGAVSASAFGARSSTGRLQRSIPSLGLQEPGARIQSRRGSARATSRSRSLGITMPRRGASVAKPPGCEIKARCSRRERRSVVCDRRRYCPGTIGSTRRARQ